MAEASSGKEVPMATTVKPMTKSLTPSDTAMFTAPHTKARELTMSSNKPTISQIIAGFIGRGFASSSSVNSAAKLSSLLFEPIQIDQPM